MSGGGIEGAGVSAGILPVTVIGGDNPTRSLGLRELWDYRDLLRFVVWRDIKVRYAQTVLGLSWAVLRPLVSMILFSVVFGGLANLPSDGMPYPLFSYAALVPWTYFSTSLASAAGSLVGNNLISKVYFPRLVVPLAPVLSNLLDLVISLLPLVVLMVVYSIHPSWQLVLLPLYVLIAAAFAMGLGLWLGALAVQYRDVRHITGFLTTILMYGAPVVWSMSLIPEQYRFWVGLYPLVCVIEGFRSSIVGSPVPWYLLLGGSFSTFVFVVSGMWYFRRRERFFADVF